MKQFFIILFATILTGSTFAQQLEMNPNFTPTTENLTTPAPTRVQGEIHWLTSQTEYTSFGNAQSTWTAMPLMEFTVDDIANWEGQTITSIDQISFMIAAAGVATATDCKAVIRQGTSLTTSEEVMAVPVSAPIGGWNVVDLPTSYTVNPGQNLYIGYTITCTNVYALSVSQGSNPKQAHMFWNGAANNLITSGSGNYTFLVKAMATLGAQEDVAIRLESIEAPANALIGNELTVKGVVKNIGVNPITAFDAAYTINGTDVEQQFTGLDIAPGASYDLSFTEIYVLNDPLYYTLEVNVSNPNGVTDNEADNSQSKSFSVLSEIVQRRVLLEGISGSTCGPCVTGNINLKTALANTDTSKYVSLKYQMNWPGNGDPYYTLEGGSRRTYYNLNSIPFMVMNGGVNVPPFNTSSITVGMINNEASIPAKGIIEGTATQSGKTVAANITFTPVTASNGNQRLFATIAEKHTTQNAVTTPNQSNGETDFYNIMKKFLTSAAGDALPEFTAGEPVNVALSWTFNGEYRKPNNALSPINHATEHSVEEFTDLEVIFWVQDVVTKEVWQAGRADAAASSGQLFAVTYQQPENGTLDVIANGEAVTSGAMVDADTELTITATPAEGYTLGTLTVNGEDFTSGSTHTVTADVEIACNFIEEQGIYENTLSGVTVYSNANSIYIGNNNNTRLTSVEIIDITGRVIYHGEAATSTIIPVAEANGVYMVRLISEEGKTQTVKVFLNN